MKRISAIPLVYFLLFTTHVQATLSIGATDKASGQIGGAAFSCLGWLRKLPLGFAVHLYTFIYRVPVESSTVYLTQAMNVWKSDPFSIENIKKYEIENRSSNEIMSDLTVEQSRIQQFLNHYNQFAVVPQNGQPITYTGENADAAITALKSPGVQWTRTISTPQRNVSVQGNTLSEREVVDRAFATVQREGCDLAESLLLALESAAKSSDGKPAGDKRCIDSKTGVGIPGDEAFIRIERPLSEDPTRTNPFLLIRAGESQESNGNPLLDLRAQYNEWRKTHPCPTSKVISDEAREGRAFDGTKTSILDENMKGISEKSLGIRGN